jgi:hypothetical protein
MRRKELRSVENSRCIHQLQTEGEEVALDPTDGLWPKKEMQVMKGIVQR